MSRPPPQVPRTGNAGVGDRAASLRRLHGLVRSVNGDLDLGRTLVAVCRGVVEGLGFQVAAVNLVQPGGELEVVACEGSAAAEQLLLGQRGARAFWDDLIRRCEPVGDLLVDYRHVVVDSGSLRDRDAPGGAAAAALPLWTSDLPPPAQDGAWDPRDMLLAPLRTRQSGLLGVLSVDLPHDGLRPGPDQLELLEMYAVQASVAIENAQLHSSLQAQDAARARALGRLSAVVDSAPVAIVELDLDGAVQLWNEAAETMFGWSEQEVLGRRNPVAPEGAYRTHLQQLLATRSLHRMQLTRTRRDGSCLDLEATTSALLDEAGRPYGYLGVYVDVTHRRQLEQELRAAAYTDPLTGLANRARFTAGLAAAEVDAHVVLLDLDGFKNVNDTLGHAAGDRLLVEVAGRLRGVCREEDLVARLGGDEFVVLLSPGAAGDDPGAAAEVLARRLVDVLAVPYHLAGRQVSLGASVGLARAGHPSGDPGGAGRGEALLRDADVAMYAAKAEGKGRVRVFEPALRAALVEHTELAQDLRAAVARDEVALVWQPVADVSGGTVVGLEALLRWSHPRRGEVTPEALGALAEETGVAVALGTRALVQACAALHSWQQLRPAARATGRPLSAAVPLSRLQLRDPGLVEAVRRAVQCSGIAPQTLVLGLPDDVLESGGERVAEVLRRLRGLGVRLAVDGFGGAATPLSSLRRLPLDVVKLDGSLLVDVSADPAARALLEAVVALTLRLGLTPLVAGVRTPAQWQLLDRLGCRLAQGPLLSPALPADQVPAVLDSVLAGRPAH